MLVQRRKVINPDDVFYGIVANVVDFRLYGSVASGYAEYLLEFDSDYCEWFKSEELEWHAPVHK